jgi:hypothetical protein
MFANPLKKKTGRAAGGTTGNPNWAEAAEKWDTPPRVRSSGGGCGGGGDEESTVLLWLGLRVELLVMGTSCVEEGLGKLVLALAPRNSRAAVSYARAASSAVSKVPSQTRVFFPGSRISAAYRPQGRFLTPLKRISFEVETGLTDPGLSLGAIIIGFPWDVG